MLPMHRVPMCDSDPAVESCNHQIEEAFSSTSHDSVSLNWGRNSCRHLEQNCSTHCGPTQKISGFHVFFFSFFIDIDICLNNTINKVVSYLLIHVWLSYEVSS